jgi:hypothetical protein
MSKIVIAVEESRNSKTGKVAVTYAPIQSCPSTCRFLNSGCYAQHGNTGIHLRRINKETCDQKKTRPIDIAREEAKAIKEMTGEKPLRLHIVGDCKTAKSAQIVSNACKDYKARHGNKVWTYTHAWREIPREKWGEISVLASCETIEEAKHAMRRGYAASIVIAKQFDKPFHFQGVNMVPCLEMTKGTKCDKCRLCMHDKKLHEGNKVICFFVHGSAKESAKKALSK